jgi:hypothetical protein
MRLTPLLLTTFCLAVVYGCSPHTIPLDADVTFAMHQESREFVVDRPTSGASALVTAATWLRLPGDPAWALRRDGETLAAYWIDGNASTSARAGMRASDRPLGEVRPSWDDNAIRVRIEPAEGQPIQSDTFARTDGASGTTALSRTGPTNLDLRGHYRAVLRDAAGAEVGWLRLRIGPYEPAGRIYEGVLPTGVDEGLAVAAVLALANEIDWIESHSLNVYQGDRAPLTQSLPIH